MTDFLKSESFKKGSQSDPEKKIFSWAKKTIKSQRNRAT